MNYERFEVPVVVGGVEKERFNLQCRPHPDDTIEQGALDTHGITKEDFEKYPDPKTVYQYLFAMFSKYINKFDKRDKFFAGGKNVKFDLDFSHNHFIKHGKPHPKQDCTGDPFLFLFRRGKLCIIYRAFKYILLIAKQMN